MALYLRYSNSIESDIERGYSYHYTGLDKSCCETIQEVAEACNIDESKVEFNEDADQYVQALPGLCAFELESDNLEDAIEEAKEFRYNDVYNSNDMTNWSILEGDYVDDCPEGDTICNVKLLYSNNND